MPQLCARLQTSAGSMPPLVSVSDAAPAHIGCVFDDACNRSVQLPLTDCCRFDEDGDDDDWDS